MAFKAGKFASVRLAATTVVGMRSWEMPGVTVDLIETTSFGDSAKKFIAGLLDYGTVSFRGVYDPADAGQSTLITDNYQGKTVTDIRLYIDSTSYWTPNITADANSGFLVQSFGLTAANAGLVEVNFGGKATGPWILV